MARADASFSAFVRDQLSALPGVTLRAMFGGHGVYQGPRFFGIVFKGRLYLKTDDTTRPAYVARGMKPFRPSAAQTLKRYYEVPADVLEDGDQLVEWAQQALRVAAGQARER